MNVMSPIKTNSGNRNKRRRVSPAGPVERCVYVVLAVHRPNPSYFKEQLRSIVEQTYQRISLVFVVDDDVSTDFVKITARQYGLEFTCLSPPEHLGVVAAFEYGIRHVVSHSGGDDLVAFCDQDDVWDKSKVQTCVETLDRKGVSLVHSDTAVISSQGEFVSQSLFRLERRSYGCGVRDLLCRNNVTGMTAVFTMDVARCSVPFPSQASTFFYHDLWISLVATVLRGVAFVDQPLVQYRMHNANVIGPLTGTLATRECGIRARMRMIRSSYFLAAYLAKSLALRSHQIEGVLPGQLNHAELLALKPYLSMFSPGLGFIEDSLRFLPSEQTLIWPEYRP